MSPSIKVIMPPKNKVITPPKKKVVPWKKSGAKRDLRKDIVDRVVTDQGPREVYNMSPEYKDNENKPPSATKGDKGTSTTSN